MTKQELLAFEHISDYIRILKNACLKEKTEEEIKASLRRVLKMLVAETYCSLSSDFTVEESLSNFIMEHYVIGVKASIDPLLHEGIQKVQIDIHNTTSDLYIIVDKYENNPIILRFLEWISKG